MISPRGIYEIGFNDGEKLAESVKDLLKNRSPSKIKEGLWGYFFEVYIQDNKTMNEHLTNVVKADPSQKILLNNYYMGVKNGISVRINIFGKAKRVTKTITQQRTRPSTLRHRVKTTRSKGRQ